MMRVIARTPTPLAGDLLSVAPGGLAVVSHGKHVQTQCEVSTMQTVRAEDADRLRAIGEAAWAGVGYHADEPAPNVDLTAAFVEGLGYRALRGRVREQIAQQKAMLAPSFSREEASMRGLFEDDDWPLSSGVENEGVVR